ncbi:DUF5134 domain-containing protein [Trebonia sp.]|uniref:DUF5134 domain-containing protein n=1 Tax=Trebonia sp. TaxID=2767075 RepID=UPI00263997DE|nr:DUF5134 domain-containing protein [Trebonia sp.]
MTPAWILDIFAALMLVVAAVSAARLVAARPWQAGSATTPDIDVAHLLMGIAMAGMLAAGLVTLSNPAWVVIFAVLTAWFAVRVLRDASANGVRALAGGHCAPHLVHCGAMVYMFAAIAAPAAAAGGGMGGMGGSSTQALDYPTLAFVFALVLIGYSIWDIDRLSGMRYSRAVAGVSRAAVPAIVGAGAADATVSGAQATVASAANRAPSGSAGDGQAVAGDRGTGSPAGRGFLQSPATAVGCRIAMGVTMALMLLLII